MSQSRKEWMERLLHVGGMKGYLTYDEINQCLPDEATSDDMEDLLDELEAHDVEVLDGSGIA